MQALEERYKVLHTIRDRVQNLSIWVLGLFITSGGWLLQTDMTMRTTEKLFFSIAIILSIIFIRVFYLRDLEKGFKTQQQIQAKIETLLGLCTPGMYIQDSVYPQEWAHAGTKRGRGRFFLHNYLLIYLATVILLVCIWFKQ